MKEHYKIYLFDFEKIDAYDTYENKLKIGGRFSLHEMPNRVGFFLQLIVFLP